MGKLGVALWGWRMGAGKKSRYERQGWKGEWGQIGKRHIYMAFWLWLSLFPQM